MTSILFIVPTRNSLKELKKLVKSLIEQTDPNWRAIFIDYKSNKENKNYLKKLCKFDRRFLIKEQIINNGIYGAQNLGFKFFKKNEWLLFWGSDDYASSNKIVSIIRKEISRNINIDLIIFSGKFVSRIDGKPKSLNHFTKLSNNYFDNNEYRKKIFYGFRQAHQATLINPKNNLKDLLYDENYFLAADLNYYLDCTKINNLKSKFCNINIVNIGIGGISRKRNIMRFKEVLSIYWKNFKILFLIPFILRYLKC